MLINKKQVRWVGLAVVLAALAPWAEAQEKQERRVIRVERHGDDNPEIHFYKPSRIVEHRVVKKVGDDRAGKEGTWLGVHIGRVSDVTAAQLGLKPGTGLVVEHVVAESPAKEAGLKRYDILTAIDDQILVNPDQLQVLVGAAEPGEEVSLSLIRGGKKRELKATLAKRKMAGMILQTEDIHGELLHGFNQDGEMVVRKWTQASDGPGEDLDSIIWRGKVRDDVTPFHSRTIQLGNAVTVLRDGSGTYHLKDNNGKRHLRFEDKDGNVIYDGVFKGAETKELPVDVIRKLEKIRVPEEVGVKNLNRIFKERRKSDLEEGDFHIEVDVESEDSVIEAADPDRSL